MKTYPAYFNFSSYNQQITLSITIQIMDLKNYIRPGNGASDIMPLLANAESFHYTIEKLSELSQINQPSKIMGIEGRGFILGSAVAFNLGIGFVPVRSFGKLKNSTFKTTYIDYSNNEKIM